MIWESLDAELKAIEAEGLTRRRRIVDSPCGPEMVADGKPVLAFCSNDYLGLAAHPAVVEALAEGARSQGFVQAMDGRAEIVAFLTRKWNRVLDYRLIKELWAVTGNRIAVRFAYEWHDDSGNWFRSYGNENWEFEADGLMHRRFACINDMPIKESERKFHWPLGRRPDDHPGLTELGL